NVTLNIMRRVRNEVFYKAGTLRRLSSEVEELLRTSLIDEDVGQAFKRMNVDMKTIFSPEGVKQGRPKLQGPPSEIIIRKMRGRRIAEGLS
ncbi:MAG: hypothetical protein ACPLY9_07205, partial [Nitrososphaerales archaeon]